MVTQKEKESSKMQNIGLHAGRHWAINLASLQELRHIADDYNAGELSEAGSYVLDYGIYRALSSAEIDADDVDEGFRVKFLAGVMSAIDEFAEAWPGYEHFAAIVA